MLCTGSHHRQQSIEVVAFYHKCGSAAGRGRAVTIETYLETIRFGAYGPGAPDMFDVWAGHSPNHILRRAADRFCVEASFWQLDRIVLTEQRIDPFLASRTAEHALAVPTNQVTFVVLFDGTLTYRDGEGEQLCETGDVVLLDFQRTYEFVTGPQHSTTISMDRGILEDDAGQLVIHGRMPRTPETRMFADFVRTLVTQLPNMATASAIPAATILRRMILLALRRGHPPVEAPRTQTERARALAYIEAQAPGTLDVAAMSDALNLTRATLYRLFKTDGGVLAYDRRRRLRLLHRSLCEERADVPLGSLGARFGFLDLSNLSRQFKAQFGLSMSEVRRHLLPRLRAEGSIERYREAIARFE